MTRKLFFATAAMACLAVAACQKKEGDNSAGMNPGQTEAVNAVQDAAAGPVGQAGAAMAANTTEGFVTQAAMSDMYEIEAGKIAATKAKSPKVKEFAAMMVKDHTASSSKMKGLLPAGMTPPAALDERRKGMLDNLRATNGDDFDTVYMDQQSNAHAEAVTLFRGYADNGDTPGLKGFAAQTLPVIEKHHEMAKSIDRGGADGAGNGAAH
jgi:putative membrane protein